jgi:hypothetical protein
LPFLGLQFHDAAAARQAAGDEDLGRAALSTRNMIFCSIARILGVPAVVISTFYADHHDSRNPRPSHRALSGFAGSDFQYCRQAQFDGMANEGQFSIQSGGRFSGSAR